MPSPVDALPWGSRSTISTCSPIAASAVPRLIAVVVLPTPPFWLAMASTRGGCRLEAVLARGMTWGASSDFSGINSADALGTFSSDACGGASALSVIRASVLMIRESPRILWLGPNASQISDDDDAAGRIGAAGQHCDVQAPRLCGPRIGSLAQFNLCTLSLREQG